MVKSNKEKLQRYVDNWDKPLTPSRPAPKPSSSKKKGRKAKEQDEGEEKTE